MLNTGFKFNGVYTICVGDDHEDRDFHTFCPKAIFGLAATKLPDTTRSRCFLLTLQKKLRSECVDKLTRKFSGEELRRKCLRWATDNASTLTKVDPVMPPGLSARQEDISEPLLAVADACGGSWPEIVRQCILSFFGELDPDEGDIKRELLADIRLGFSEQDPPDRFAAKTMMRYLNSLEHRPWHSWNDGDGITQRQIADRLRSYRIHSRNMKVAEDIAKSGVAKGYLLTDFADAFTRYLSTDTDSNRYSATEPATIDRNAVLASATVSAGSASQNATLANDDALGSAVADRKATRAGKCELVEEAL